MFITSIPGKNWHKDASGTYVLDLLWFTVAVEDLGPHSISTSTSEGKESKTEAYDDRGELIGPVADGIATIQVFGRRLMNSWTFFHRWWDKRIDVVQIDIARDFSDHACTDEFRKIIRRYLIHNERYQLNPKSRSSISPHEYYNVDDGLISKDLDVYLMKRKSATSPWPEDVSRKLECYTSHIGHNFDGEYNRKQDISRIEITMREGEANNILKQSFTLKDLWGNALWVWAHSTPVGDNRFNHDLCVHLGQWAKKYKLSCGQFARVHSKVVNGQRWRIHRMPSKNGIKLEARFNGESRDVVFSRDLFIYSKPLPNLLTFPARGRFLFVLSIFGGFEGGGK